jgi:hypothetical protein
MAKTQTDVDSPIPNREAHWGVLQRCVEHAARLRHRQEPLQLSQAHDCVIAIGGSVIK